MSQPAPITTSITWFPGGAQRDEHGEPVPWPWPGASVSKAKYLKIRRTSHADPIPYECNCSKMHENSWFLIEWYAEFQNPADLEPPKWE